MTYDEIKKRLTEVETALQSMQNKKSAKLETSYTAKSIGRLTTIKESLQKQLAEKEETMFISTKGGDTKAVAMDRKSAMDLKKDPNITGIDTAKGQKIKEQEGINFSVEETKAIAKSAGKALAIALKKAGDEIARMKARRIEENSFDINVVYRGEKGEDEFSFYISEDTLHLVDFSFDKELVDVGVKPSGEAIVNVDVLANELLKHFKSLNEEMAVFSSEEEEDKYIEKMVKRGLEKEKERAAKKKKRNLKEVNYDHYTEPKHFDICPGAETLRDEVLASGKTPEELGEWTFKHDELFRLEKAVLKANKADERHVKVAKELAGEITHHSRDLGIEANKIGYLKGHIKKIEDVAKKTDGRGDNMSLRSRDIYEGEGDDHHYIKVPRRDFKKAEAIIAQNIDGNYVKMDYVDDDGAGNVIIYFMFKDRDIASGEADSFMYDVVMDLQAHGIRLSDHSAELDENVTQKHIDDIEASGNIDIAYKKAMELLKSMLTKNEALDINDPALMRARVAKMRADDLKKLDAYKKSPEGRAAARAQASAERKEEKAREIVRKLKIKRAEIEREMENDPDIEPQGGPVADMYGDQLNKIDNEIEKAASVYNKPMDYDTAVGLRENQPTVFDDQSMDALRDIILKYVEDPDDAEAAVQQVDDQGLDSLSPELIANLERDPEFEAWYDKLHNGPSADTDYMQRRRAEKDYMEEDTDVGHQDDEPGMLKSTSYEIATYAAKLYKKLAQYDQVDGEVDFPNWWQSKLILAKDYVSKAYHYLDSEEKQPIIDKLALEHAINESTDLFRDDKFAFTRFSMGKEGPGLQVTNLKKLDEYIHVSGKDLNQFVNGLMKAVRVFDDMKRQLPVDEVKAAKVQKAYSLVVAKMKELAKQYKAGDKSVVPQLKDLTAKKKALEADLERAVAGTHQGQELTELSTDQRNDLVELQNILDDVAQKGEEAREIIRQSFPRMLSKADAYGAFDFGSSANRYDTTLESIIEEIEEYYDEEEDLDEGKEKEGQMAASKGKKYSENPYEKGTKDHLAWSKGHNSSRARKLSLADEGKYKSDAQRKAIYATKAEKGELKEEMDGGRLFDYFKSKGYDVTERRPDGYPPKEGVKGYQVSRGSDRYPQSVIFQYNKDTNKFTISRMSGYRIDQKEAIKAGMRQAGRSGAAGMDSYMTDGNYTPVSISAEGLKDIVDHVMSGLDRESKAQTDFYADRGPTSGTIDEDAVKELYDKDFNYDSISMDDVKGMDLKPGKYQMVFKHKNGKLDQRNYPDLRSFTAGATQFFEYEHFLKKFGIEDKVRSGEIKLKQHEDEFVDKYFDEIIDLINNSSNVILLVNGKPIAGGTINEEKGQSFFDMTRAELIDFLNTTEDEVEDMSYKELRDAAIEKNYDLKEEKIEVDADTKFELPLKHLIQKHVKEVMNKRKKKEFKVGDKVTYLGHPGVITKVNKEMTGAITYNVAYDKGEGRTKVTNIYNKDGEIKALTENKATCCGKCGRVHVKDSGCKRPYLKGKSHCRNK